MAEVPMVFSCTKCNVIISDSTEYLCAYQDITCIVMAGGTNIHIATEVNGGCNPLGYYQQISCSSCGAEVGKRYVTALANHPMARDKLCLSVSAMDSYQLGTGEVRACDKPPASSTEGVAAEEAVGPESSSLQQRIAELENDLVKVQNMVLLHQERLEALEGTR